MKFDADWTNFQIKPEKKDKNGLTTQPRYATITLKVDMDTPETEKAVSELVTTLNRGESVTASIDPYQKRLPSE